LGTSQQLWVIGQLLLEVLFQRVGRTDELGKVSSLEKEYDVLVVVHVRNLRVARTDRQGTHGNDRYRPATIGGCRQEIATAFRTSKRTARP
jgi:hypothetical protein